MAGMQHKGTTLGATEGSKQGLCGLVNCTCPVGLIEKSRQQHAWARGCAGSGAHSASRVLRCALTDSWVLCACMPVSVSARRSTSASGLTLLLKRPSVPCWPPRLRL
jgi:hypothetical protein